MVTKPGRVLAALALLSGLLVVSPACVPAMGNDDVWRPGNRGRVIVGEVRSIDHRRGRLHIRENRGRSQVVYFSNRTPVVVNRRQHRPSVLSRGDHVQARVSYDRRGTAYADRIDVRRSGSYGRRPAARVMRVDGVVRGVDTRRGYFVLDRGRSGAVTVYVRGNMSRNDARRFDRLRRGQRVRAEVRDMNRNSAVLVRFR